MEVRLTKNGSQINFGPMKLLVICLHSFLPIHTF